MKSLHITPQQTEWSPINIKIDQDSFGESIGTEIILLVLVPGTEKKNMQKIWKS